MRFVPSGSLKSSSCEEIKLGRQPDRSRSRRWEQAIRGEKRIDQTRDVGWSFESNSSPALPGGEVEDDTTDEESPPSELRDAASGDETDCSRNRTGIPDDSPQRCQVLMLPHRADAIVPNTMSGAQAANSALKTPCEPRYCDMKFAE